MTQSDPAPSTGPLAGLRILDFTRVLSGPYCTALLADLGAEVVKVEAPQGDDYRHVGPFREGQSALFQLVNRNKRGIAIDLKQPAGQALARDLAARADVVVENFRPGVAARLGLDAERLMAADPRLVYASISGFGQSGPNAALPAFDLVAQALSGFMALTGEAAGSPMKTGESIGDLAAGLFASWSILAALLERERTGRGRRLDIAMVDSLVALLPTAVAQWMFGAGAPTRVGNRHPLSTPFGAYRARDGHLVICVLNQTQFRHLAETLDQPDLADDPRFASDARRTEHEAILRARIEAGLARWTVAEAVAALSAAGVPAAAIAEAAAVFEGEHVRARGLIGETGHPRLGPIPAMEQPVHFAGLPRGGQRPAPALGADNADVLSRWLSLDDTGIATLAADGTITREDRS
ncbi:CoA transferase [Zavarzinia compransoris]|uniref:CaiB/BaiF CoA transferase family protein n=1 Tax=Zavarzinia marina TaxID=2911065 RepID=UPI001F485097|nr:CoA transferase [Zavarzinia marina]MCF4167319.1 CoA transferase [Zavarzinia marina]